MERINKKEDICVAAELDGHVVGWIGGAKVQEKTDVPTARAGVVILAKKGRGYKNFRGLAEKWLEEAQKEWGIEKIITETSNSNRAKNLYKRLGFVEVGPSDKQEGYIKLEKTLE